MRLSQLIIFICFFILLVGCSKAYTINLDSNNGEEKIQLKFKNGEELEITEPTKIGHTFIGWYLDDEFNQKFILKQMPKKNLSLYAKWEPNSYNISFIENGGTEVADLKLMYQGDIELPTPSLLGHEFIGWYTSDDQLFSDVTMPPYDITLYAKWSKFYNVIFDSNGGNLLESKTYLEGSNIDNLPTPTRDGYSFLGWYLDRNLQESFNYTIMPNNNITLYAKWQLIKSNLVYTYLPSEDAYMISGYNDNQTTIIIPRMYNDKKVIKIGDYAFEHHNIINVIFEENSEITSIGNYAFLYTLISDIAIPKSVRTIGIGAFYMTTSLNSIIFPRDSELTTINSNALTNTNLQTLYIPKNVVFIAYDNLHSTELTAINVHPENLFYSSEDGILFNHDKTILLRYPINKQGGEYTISNHVKHLEQDAFFLTKNLLNVYFTENTELKSIGYSAFRQSSLRSITIPKQIESIGEYAFAYSSSLKNINFEQGSQLSSIHSNAFNRVGITTIHIPKHVSFIHSGAFENVINLEIIDVDINNISYSSVDGVLYDKNQTNLLIYPKGKKDQLFIVPSSVQCIKGLAFLFTSHLMEVRFNLDSKLNSIENYAFFSTELEKISLPASLMYIGGKAFSNTNLKELTISEESPVYISEDNVLYNKDRTILYLYADGKNEETYTIKKSVEIITDYAFYGANNIKNIQFENGSQLNRIGSYAFAEAKNLTTIILPKSLVTISNNAFFNSTNLVNVHFEENSELTFIYDAAFQNTSLIKIVIPSKVNLIGTGAFSDIKTLTTLSFEGNSQIRQIDDRAFYNNSNLTINFTSLVPPKLGSDVFNTRSSVIIYVPQATIHDYQDNQSWLKYSHIIYAK